MQPERVWYVAYGSNVNETRFLRYLNGDADHVGARSSAPAERSEWTTAPLQLRFAGESQRWGGGVCFVDPDPGALAYVRAWDITSEQFEDVFSQENRRSVGEPLDWPTLAAGPTVVGDSWYSLVLPVSLPFDTDGQPAFTFTWTNRFPLNPPSAAYRDTITSALVEHPDLSPGDVDSYLASAVANVAGYDS